MKRLSLLLLLGVTFPLLLPADEDTRQVQQALKAQGFYYGDVNGAPGDETTQAIRRFQIRNALPVTGNLDAGTRKAIIAGGDPATQAPAPAAETPADPPAQAPPRYIPPPTVSQPARPDLRAEPPQQPPSAPRARDSSIPDGPVLDGPNNYRGGSSIFNNGPYADAPPFVQSSVLGQAQAMLTREGFYNGPVDGQPGQRTAEALLSYQAAYGLPRSGRLDASTIRALGIAPVGTATAPRRTKPARPRYYEPPAPRPQAPGVYEGRIVP